MTRSNHRLERINAIVKEVLSELVLNEIKDPRLGLVTIVSVRVAPDLSTAKVYFSVMGDEAQRAVSLKILRGASNFLRHVIADEISVKNAPELHWKYDDSLDRSFRITEILKQSAESSAPPAATGAAEPAQDGDDGEGEPA